MKKWGLILLAISLVSILFLSACAQTEQTTTPGATTTAKTTTSAPATTATATTPQYGGYLKILSTPGITSLGYPGKITFGGEQALERPAIQYLLSRDPKTMQYVGELAETFEFSADYLTFTMTLRKGVKFHDGTDFNADAVKYNLELVKKGVRSSDLLYCTSIDVLDPYKIQLKFSKFDVGFIDVMCSMSGGMVSPTYLKTVTNDADFKPVGTGPYKFVSYQRDVSLKFERFDDYWGGKPYLDGLEFVFVADPVTQLASFKAGEADVIRQIDIVGALDLEKSGKYTLLKYPQQIWGIAGDGGHTDSIFSDIRIRKAVSHAIDAEAITKAIGKGYFTSTNQWDRKDGLYYDQNIAGYPYNPQKAKELLAEAGYPNGLQTKISLPSAVPTPDMMQMVQNYLNEVGIKATLDTMDPSKYNQFVKDGWTNQLVFFWIAGANGIADGFKSKMTSKATGFSTKSLLIPEDYNAKYLEAGSEPDAAKRKALFQEFLKMATDKYCIATPILVNYYFKATTSKVHDCDMYDYGMNEWRPEKMWLSK